MNKKDYLAIALIINQNYHVSNQAMRFVLRDIVDQFAQLFENENPLFHRSKFTKACLKDAKT